MYFTRYNYYEGVSSVCGNSSSKYKGSNSVTKIHYKRIKHIFFGISYTRYLSTVKVKGAKYEVSYRWR